MKPSNYTGYPWSCKFNNSESETIAQNIMVILSRTGDTFREITWNEYKKERKKDGNFSDSEKDYFDRVIPYCTSPEKANEFCTKWTEYN